MYVHSHACVGTQIHAHTNIRGCTRRQTDRQTDRDRERHRETERERHRSRDLLEVVKHALLWVKGQLLYRPVLEEGHTPGTEPQHRAIHHCCGNLAIFTRGQHRWVSGTTVPLLYPCPGAALPQLPVCIDVKWFVPLTWFCLTCLWRSLYFDDTLSRELWSVFFICCFTKV